MHVRLVRPVLFVVANPLQVKMWLMLLSLIFVGLLLYRLFVFKIPHGMPPGPIFGVPLLGTGIHLGENPLPGVKNLRKKKVNL